MHPGKPCVLKCHIGQRLRTARPMLAGRQIDPGKQLLGQINDSWSAFAKVLADETESGLWPVAFFVQSSFAVFHLPSHV